MLDTMTLTKIIGGFCGSLLVFLLGNWMAERSGEAVGIESQLRNQLFDSQERVTDLVKESINDTLIQFNRTKMLLDTTHQIDQYPIHITKYFYHSFSINDL